MIADLLARKAAPLQALDVDAVRLGRIARDDDERRHVLRQAGVHADEGMGADFAELVHGGKAATGSPSRRRAHGRASCALFEKIVLLPTWQSCARCTYARIQLSLPRRVTPASCAVPRLNVQNSRIGVAVADFKPGRLAAVFLVLRRARRSKQNWKKRVVAADRRMAFDHHVRPDLGAGADRHVRPDDGIRADLDRAVQLRLRDRRSRGRMDRASLLPRWLARIAPITAHRAHQLRFHRHLAVDAWLSPCISRCRATVRRISTSILSWSPGSTGRLKRAPSMPTKYTTRVLVRLLRPWSGTTAARRSAPAPRSSARPASPACAGNGR